MFTMLGCWVVVLVETGECRASPGVSSVKTTKKVSGAGRGGPRGSNREGLQDCSSWASQLPRVTLHFTSTRMEGMEVMEVIVKMWREWRGEREWWSVSAQLCVSLSEWRPPTLPQCSARDTYCHTTHLPSTSTTSTT